MSNFRNLAFCLGALASMAATQVRAEGGRSPVVVELYTSQGCTACPPADALLSEIADEDGVIALALHVDYWDYIGWKDTFASPAHTARQKAYARAAGEKMVYTPQMVVNGRDRIVGVDATGLARLLKAEGNGAGPALALTRSGSRIEVRAEPATIPQGSVVQVVSYIPRASVLIERGENAGRTIIYSNVVTRWQAVADWDGRTPLDLVAEVPSDMGVAVLLQAPGPGPILAAAAMAD